MPINDAFGGAIASIVVFECSIVRDLAELVSPTHRCAEECPYKHVR